MILAAGAGRRMQPLTHSRAKPALPVLGIPLVAHAARLLHAAGIREIVVNLHHQGQTVRTALEQRQRDPRHLALSQVAFSYSPEDALQGTAGGIGRVREWLAAEGTAIVVNSDFISDIDLATALAEHRRSGARGTLVVTEPSGPFPGEVWTDAGGRVLSIGPPPAGRPDATGPFEFTGVQILEPELLERFPQRPSDSIRDVYLPALAQINIASYRHGSFWWEFGSLDRYLEGQLRLVRERRHLEEGALLEMPGGSLVWLGPGANLSPAASIRGVVVIEGGARVSSGAAVEDSVILEHAQVPSWCRLSRCVLAAETVLTGGLQFDHLAIASSPCAAPSGLAMAPETPGGRPSPPEGCQVARDLWLRPLAA